MQVCSGIMLEGENEVCALFLAVWEQENILELLCMDDAQNGDWR